MAWEHQGCPPGRWPGVLGPRGRFQSRSRSQSPAAMETAKALGSLICEAGVGSGPTAGDTGH